MIVIDFIISSLFVYSYCNKDNIIKVECDNFHTWGCKFTEDDDSKIFRNETLLQEYTLLKCILNPVIMTVFNIEIFFPK
jgi:hypothetical protein